MPRRPGGHRRVFEPIRIAGVEIPNRIVRTGHLTGLGNGGGVTDDLVAYHEARAKGGVGLLFLEHSSLHRTSPSTTITWADERVIPGFQLVSAAVHRHGARIFQQILHRGPQCAPLDGSAPLAASPLAVPGTSLMPRAPAADELAEIVSAYVAAGARARDGDLDGVEILAGHGYLIHTFLSPLFNQRTDSYGGSPENRRRFLIEVLSAMRAALPGYPIGVRFSVTEHIAGGMGPDETLAVAQHLEQSGLVDFVNLSVGGYASPAALSSMIGPMHEPHGYQLDLTEPVAAGLTEPTIVTGRIMNLDEAEDILARGNADLVSMVRATIADPDLVNKSRAGRADEVRPCIGCNQGCLGGIWGPSRRLGCVVNPAVGHEAVDHQEEPPTSGAGRRVLVIGGGPAGLEAARTAAERGHSVTLVERADHVGGQLREAMTAPYREEFGRILQWWEAELDRLAVKVLAGTDAGADAVRSLDPEAVIIATGARPASAGGPTRFHPEGLVPGEGSRLLAASEAETLMSEEPADVVVVDDTGGYEAVGIAERAAGRGHRVTFVTSDNYPGALLANTTTMEPTVSRLTEMGVCFSTRSVVEAVDSVAVTVAGIEGGGPVRIRADWVMLVRPRRPRDELVDDLAQIGIEAVVVGDAAGVRDLQAAVREGRRAALAVK
jgi:2,4-dienoyl-CoA reductase-like NADH-dependent reductase (Old Yellow Enzyme family)